ncbi:MAG: hypothetical protein P0120_17225 [Nitrospira sp.]|nr:hypothetical protein [Nitrospira sp.]
MTHKTIEKVGRILLVCLMASGGCASREPLDSSSDDPSYDQTAITNLYRNRAADMHEKANAQATAATRYEALFGPEADLVSGARSLASYYEQTAKEFERLAEAHASVDRTRQRPTTVP